MIVSIYFVFKETKYTWSPVSTALKIYLLLLEQGQFSNIFICLYQSVTLNWYMVYKRISISQTQQKRNRNVTEQWTLYGPVQTFIGCRIISLYIHYPRYERMVEGQRAKPSVSAGVCPHKCRLCTIKIVCIKSIFFGKMLKYPHFLLSNVRNMWGIISDIMMQETHFFLLPLLFSF